MEIRKIVTVVEDILVDGAKKADKPVRKAAAIAVIKNPFAGVYQEDLTTLINDGEELGRILGRGPWPHWRAESLRATERRP